MAKHAETDVPRGEEEPRGVEKELADLRREVIEARNLVIKTDNQVKNLYAELKTVSKRNDDHYKRTWVASAAAYVLFLAAAIGLASLGARASVATERNQTEAARVEADGAKKRAEEAVAQLAAQKSALDLRLQASNQAMAAYALLTQGQGEQRLRGIDALAAIDRAQLSELEKRTLDERARGLKDELGGAALERGKSAFRRQDMRGAVADLTRYLSLDPSGDEVPNAEFLLGAALYQLKDFPGAVKHLEVFAANSKGQRNVDYGLYLLGQSLEQTGNLARALEVYQRGATAYPSTEFGNSMLRRMRALQQQNTSSPAPTPVAAAVPAAPVARPAPAAVPAAAPVAPAAVPVVRTAPAAAPAAAVAPAVPVAPRAPAAAPAVPAVAPGAQSAQNP